ncbi:hypothetical protein JKP88DRAFT_353628 [Tribonema minus]|uniref:Uncharacterized protein n=1 Tax=Tribonema minus TaxID=303371 RepID=A0A836CIW4_9STRA|nr:hypothetical protein JKP88DRAFT_353628 [Tribonema minus]
MDRGAGPGASRLTAAVPACAYRTNIPQESSQRQRSPWQHAAERSTQTPNEWRSEADGGGADAAEAAALRDRLAALTRERDGHAAAFKAAKASWAASQDVLQQRLNEALSALDAQRAALGQISAAAAGSLRGSDAAAAAQPSGSPRDRLLPRAGMLGGGGGSSGGVAAMDTQRYSTSMHVGGAPSREAILTMTVESVQRVQKGGGGGSSRGAAAAAAARRASATEAAMSMWGASHIRDSAPARQQQPAAPAHATYRHHLPTYDAAAAVMEHALPAAAADRRDDAERRLQHGRGGFDVFNSNLKKVPSLLSFPAHHHHGNFVVGMNGGSIAGGRGDSHWGRDRVTAPLDSVDANVTGLKRSPSSFRVSASDDSAPAHKRVAWSSASPPPHAMAAAAHNHPLGPPAAPPLPPPLSQGLWGTTDGQQGTLKLKEAPGLVRVLFVDWDGVTKHTRRTVEEAEAYLASLDAPPSPATMIFHCFSRPPGTRGLRARVPLGGMWDAVFHATPRLAAYRHACRVFTDTCNAKDLRRSSSPSRMHGFHESVFTAHDAIREARAAAGSGKAATIGGGGDRKGNFNSNFNDSDHNFKLKYSSGGDARSSGASSPALSSPTSSDGRCGSAPPQQQMDGRGGGGSASRRAYC